MTTAALNNANLARRQYLDMGKPIIVENNLVIKAKRHPTSLKKAIGAMCFQCFGGTEAEMPDPGWKNFIRDCTSKDCALYPHRPYTIKNIADGIEPKY